MSKNTLSLTSDERDAVRFAISEQLEHLADERNAATSADKFAVVRLLDAEIDRLEGVLAKLPIS